MRQLPGRIIEAEIDGKTIYFFVSNENDAIQRHHARGQFYEKEELKIISHYFVGGCFIDIGANIGNHSVYVSKYLNASRVICIEPNPEAISILSINITLNEIGHVIDRRYLGIGLSDVAGHAVLHQPQLHNLGAMQLKAGSGSIRVAAGDDLLHTENPEFIKIDVEGMEISVIRGLERIIARCRPKMFVEVDNKNRDSFHDWCKKHGYSIEARYKRYPDNENFLVISSPAVLEGKSAEVDRYREFIERVHTAVASFVQSVFVQSTFEDHMQWDRVVHIFNLTGHPRATRAYAWSWLIKDGTERRGFAVLHEAPTVVSPESAVEAAILAERQSQHGTRERPNKS